MSLDHLSKSKSKTWIPNEILLSQAWADMGGKAHSVFLIFRSKRKPEKAPKGMKKKDLAAFYYDQPAKNERDVSFTYKEAKSLWITKRAFTYAIDTLLSHGFIDIVEHGGGLEHMSTRYGFSERWRKWGSDDSVELKRTLNHNGFCSREFHERRKEKVDGMAY